VAPSDIAFVQRSDADGVQRFDIAVADQASGDIAVLLNDPSHAFTAQSWWWSTGATIASPSCPATATAASAIPARPHHLHQRWPEGQ
jgi:hypothetical protein